MLSCSIWFSAPSFWKDGGLESRCIGRVYGADDAVQLSHMAPSAPYIRPMQRLSRPAPFQNLGAENHMLQHLMLLLMGVCTRNMSS